MISVIIPTTGRKTPDLSNQDFKDFEVLLQYEKGLVNARNAGLERAKGEIIVFTDDDVAPSRQWLWEINETFKDPEVGGVTGPSIVYSKKNRDIIAFQANPLSKIYNWIVLENYPFAIGRIFKSGQFSLGGSDINCAHLTTNIEVDYLEACNMAYRTNLIKILGGFDSIYGGIGDCSEPDLAFRVHKRGYKLIFNPKVSLAHLVSTQGIYHQRFKESSQRIKNFKIFHKRYFKWNWRYAFNLMVMRAYFIYKWIRR